MEKRKNKNKALFGGLAGFFSQPNKRKTNKRKTKRTKNKRNKTKKNKKKENM